MEGCGNYHPPVSNQEPLPPASADLLSTLQPFISTLLWDNIPSAYGVHLGISGQVGGFAEGAWTPIELLLLINLYSGEISVFASMEAYGYMGTPNFIGGNLYGGSTVIYGLSENENFVGPSLFVGATGSADEFAKAGATLIAGRAVSAESAALGEIPPQFFVDPISERTIDFQQGSIFLGVNGGANVVDFGVVGGIGITQPVWSYSIPFWPRGR